MRVGSAVHRLGLFAQRARPRRTRLGFQCVPRLNRTLDRAEVQLRIRLEDEPRQMVLKEPVT